MRAPGLEQFGGELLPRMRAGVERVLVAAGAGRFVLLGVLPGACHRMRGGWPGFLTSGATGRRAYSSFSFVAFYRGAPVLRDLPAHRESPTPDRSESGEGR